MQFEITNLSQTVFPGQTEAFVLYNLTNSTGYFHVSRKVTTPDGNASVDLQELMRRIEEMEKFDAGMMSVKPAEYWDVTRKIPLTKEEEANLNRMANQIFNQFANPHL